MNIGMHLRAELHGAEWIVMTKQGIRLGHIAWNATWNQFEFVPDMGTGFTSDCLRPLAGRLDELTADAVKRAVGLTPTDVGRGGK